MNYSKAFTGIAIIGFAFVFVQTAPAAVWHVSPGGNDSNSGISWDLAKKSIQAAVNAASEGDTVLVASGTYVLTNTVTVSIGVTISSVNGADATVVDGNYPTAAIACFDLQSSGAVLDGFTITGGYNGNGGHAGGAQNQGTIKNCIITGNAGYRGGGVYNSGIIRNCLISDNTASFYGGGAWNYGIVMNCVVAGNTSASAGGGLWNAGLALNCTVSGNSAPAGGGILNFLGVVQNSIMYYNQGGDFGAEGGSYSPQYCCAPALAGTGSITDAPLFSDPGSGDYRLLSSSPCVNAGINQEWMTNALDFAGNPRIMDGRVDMGAHECPTPRPVTGPVIKANGLSFNSIVSYPGNLSVTVQIDPGQYAGAAVDWWAVANAGSSWFYLNEQMQWRELEGDLSNCRPAYQGPLFNLPTARILSISGLQKGLYTFYFAVDYPMDGILNLDGPILFDKVNVSVQ